MLRELALVAAIAAATGAVPDAVDAGGSSCTGYTSRTTPPQTIRVFRIHRRGSSVPARVETWSFRRYVGQVMNSGAWPAHPRASGIVGAIAVKQYAWWMVLHHQPGYSWKGRCYDIRDGDQYLRPAVRPWDIPNRATRSVVDASWPVSLRKRQRLFRTGWSGERCRDGWHLCEDSVTALARRGWGWRRIIHWALDPVTIRS